MGFRPCIDIHNGHVKQIVGSSLQDKDNQAKENFVSGKDAAYYARLYKENGIKGGHIILLNASNSEYYDATKKQALHALAEYPGGMQIGGGITAENAKEYIDAGASHVIVTSYVFQNGIIDFARLEKLYKAVGKEHIVLDLSCRKKDNDYYIMTDRWQTFTSEKVNEDLLNALMDYCDEYLIHAVDVEGKSNGIEKELVELLGRWNKIPITYAGGVHSFEDIDILSKLGNQKIHFTIGSALDLFGGTLKFQDIIKKYC